MNDLETLDCHTIIGEDEDGVPITYSSSQENIESKSNEMDWITEEIFSAEGCFKEDDSEAVFQIDYLLQVLTTIKHEVDSREVKLRLNDARPITFITKDNEKKFIGQVAPLYENCPEASRLNPVEANLLGYHVLCKKRDECNWKHDRYRSKHSAYEAARDHRHLEGHRCKINDYNGKTIKEYQEQANLDG